MSRRGAAVAALLGLLSALVVGAPASADEGAADDGRIEPLILKVLAEVPGGEIVDSQRAVWSEIGMELFVPRSDGVSARAAVGSCANGKVCVYTASALSGARLSWSTCGVLTVPSSFSARSIADARSSGYAQARNGATVLATAAANSWANFGGTATNVRCVF